MPYEVNYIEGQGYILVSVKGAFALPVLKDLAEDVAKVCQKHKCSRILNDMREARLEKGAFDTVQMPQSAQKAGIERTVKRALLVPESSTEFHFLETVFINRGHVVRIFTDPDEAKEWLLWE